MTTLQTIAMPADLNSYGVMFGGWIMSQLDLAGAILARTKASSVRTVAAEQILFKAPIYAGELVSANAQIKSIGNTSIKVLIELFTTRQDGTQLLAASGVFIYVSTDENGAKTPVLSRE